MEYTTVQESAAALRIIPRPAYKGKAARWRLAAVVFATAWLFTAGVLLWILRTVEIIKVIPPTPTTIIPNVDE